MVRTFTEEAVRTNFVFYFCRVFYYHFLIRCFTSQTSVISQKISSNVSTLGSTLKSSFTEILDAVMRHNNIAEKQTEILVKIFNTHIKQNDTMIKFMKQSHRGLSDDAKPSGNNDADKKSDSNNALSNGDVEVVDGGEYDVSKSLGFELKCGQIFYFPDSTLDTKTPKENSMNLLMDMVMFALSCSLMVQDIVFQNGLDLVVVPFLVGMVDGMEDNVTKLEEKMNMLVKHSKSSKEWKNSSVQFLAFLRRADGYCVLMGGNHPMKKSRQLLVMCDKTAQHLSETEKKIAVEFFNLLIQRFEGDDVGDMEVMRCNFDGSQTVGGNFMIYLNPINHVISVPTKKTNMEFEKFYNFSSCLGSLVSIFLDNVGLKNCQYWTNLGNHKLVHNKGEKKKSDIVVDFVKQVALESMQSFIKEGVDFVNSVDGESDKNNWRELREKVEKVISAAVNDVQSAKSKTDVKKRKNAGSAAGKATTKMTKK